MHAMDNIRYNFTETKHDLLVHEPGWQTFFFENDHTLWESFGAHELGGIEYGLRKNEIMPFEGMPDSYIEICQTGVELSETTHITIRPITGWNSKYNLPTNFLQPGNYELKLFVSSIDDIAFDMNISNCDVINKSGETADNNNRKIQDPPKAEKTTFEIQDAVKIFGERVEVSSDERNTIHCLAYPIDLKCSMNSLELQLTPFKGKLRICGLVLEPIIN